MLSLIPKPRIIDKGIKTESWNWNTELRLTTWNVTSLFRTYECQYLTAS